MSDVVDLEDEEVIDGPEAEQLMENEEGALVDMEDLEDPEVLSALDQVI
jgi:hypothetical protein